MVNQDQMTMLIQVKIIEFKKVSRCHQSNFNVFFVVKFDETLAKTSRESESSNKKPEEDSKTSKDDEEENDLTLDMLRALPKAEKKALVKRLKKLIKKNKI